MLCLQGIYLLMQQHMTYIGVIVNKQRRIHKEVLY